MNNKDKSIIAMSIVVLLISTTYIVFFYKEPNPNTENDDSTKVDDRISPYTNQAIFLEIHRIRKKGIIDVMMNSGSKIVNKLPIKNEKLKFILDGVIPSNGWKTKPVFSYIATLDDYVEEGRPIYKGWDTGYMNQVIWRNVEEEQAETVVELKIIEHKTHKKFFKTTTTKNEIDSFSVKYDFRTGEWNGDDYFNDTDGYGHFNGENCEVWFSLTQTSPDNDIIPTWVEVNVLGTDPREDDTLTDYDNDGIPTAWEWKWGYDPFTWDNHSTLDPDLDGLQNTEEYFMEEWLANPFYQEIYLEADYMDKTPKKFLNKGGYDGWTHTFYVESQQMLIERYNEHGITLHIDDGSHGAMSKGGEILPFGRSNGAYQQDAGIVAGFYKNYFSEERKGIFRYLVIAYGGGWCHPQDENHWYDCMCVPHNQMFFKNQLAGALSPRTIRIGQSVQILHEMGHCLGMLLSHCGGVDNSIHRTDDPGNYPWLDYVSVMNYDYFWERHLDYSDGSNGEYDADDWSSLDLTFFQRPSEEMEGLGAL